MTLRLGVDLGGTKIELIALAGGRELLRRRVSTPQGDYQGTLSAVRDIVRGVEAELGMAGTVGVGHPGAISPVTGLIKNANSTCLIGQPLREDLQRVLGREVRLANDANCFALSEAVDGAGAGAESVFGVIVGTGTGGGLVIHGRVLTGANAIAGEWGHNPLPWTEAYERPGPSCYCGRRGCIETFLSGPGMAADYIASGGESANAREIAERAANGEALADACLERYCGRMARALASVINSVDPEVIVLGGGLSNIAGLYARVPPLWRPFVFSDHVATRLVPPRFGDSSGARGAAWLWTVE